MTDLATRIADARKKAEAWKEAVGNSFIPEREWSDARDGYTNAVKSPSLFIEMADEIDRLKAQLEKAKAALNAFDQEKHDWVAAIEQRKKLTAQLEKAREALDRIARGRFDGLEVQHLSPYEVRQLAARVHTELAEKEKEG